MPQPKKPQPQSYVVVRGINYPPDRRAEPGETRDDIPAESVAWLLEAGAIKPAKGVK